MRTNRRLQVLSGILIALALVAAVAFYWQRQPEKPPPDSGYYTGPFRSKGDPNRYATDDGKIVPPPPGASTAAVTKPGPTGNSRIMSPSTQ
ncbi:MAG TPA: hypothetical protein VFB38_23135 [Chthonomonadaceae bacterium]|nr:hypothetical protein [Chthonomonadaceae bacterium]